ncbi:hypothetical protein [Hyphomicrobium sp.]|uniref:hypothetical protein n=1 Tax=Hyphomicrobium sp. TaxID=82 RepID=UPI003F6F2B1A
MGQTYQSQQGNRSSEAQDAVHQMKKKAEDAYDTVTTEGAKALKNASASAETAIDATKRFVQEQPVLAIGTVVALACAVGALWKLSSGRRDQDLMERVSSYIEPGYRALRRRV